MQNDNLSMYDELRQMKSDYEYLKADMDKQMIINRQLMETVFRNKVGVLDANRKNTLASLSVAILATLVVSYINGASIYLTGMVVIFYVLMLAGYVFIYSKLGKIEYGTDSVLSTVTRLRKFKKNYMIVNAVSWVLLLGLLSLVFPEILHVFRIPEQGIAAVVFLCVAVLAGIFAQYFVDRKVLGTCDEIIDRLKDRS